VAQNTFDQNVQQVILDAHSIELSASKGSALQLRTNGGGLSADTGNVYSTLPTPDRPLTSQLAAAMKSFYAGAELCAVAPSTTSAGARRGVADVRAGLKELSVAHATLLRLGVHSPSTGQG